MSGIDRTCRTCKKTKINKFFTNDKGRLWKKCNKCRAANRRSVEKNRCTPHGNIMHSCVECGGQAICTHSIQKQNCKICTPPIDILIRRIVGSSKFSDIRKNRYDEDNHIDREYVQSLIDENDHLLCCYADCLVEMQFITYGKDLCTIERINNDLGHTKDNCCLCCLDCNLKKKSNLKNLYSKN